ncbi:unnamed protein product, partial [Prunus brigantina]
RFSGRIQPLIWQNSPMRARRNRRKKVYRRKYWTSHQRRLDDSLPEVEDPLQEINLGTEEDPRPTFISALLEEPLRSEIITLLHEFRDCFAWHYHEMPGLDRK